MPWIATTPEEIHALKAVQQIRVMYEKFSREYRRSVVARPDQITESQRQLQSSVVTPKPAIEGHFKTGQRPRPGLEVVVPHRWSALQEVLIGRETYWFGDGVRPWGLYFGRAPGADQREAVMAPRLSMFLTFHQRTILTFLDFAFAVVLRPETAYTRVFNAHRSPPLPWCANCAGRT